MNADRDVELDQEVDRPAPGQHAHVLVELARRHDHVDRVRGQPERDRRRVRDQRELGRRRAARAARASASPVEDASTKIVDPSSTSSRARTAIASFSCAASRTRAFQAVSIRGRVSGSERAPPRTRSRSPSPESSSRSRCTVTGETACSDASSASDAPPSRWTRSRIRARLQDRRQRGVDHARAIADSVSASNRWTRSRSTEARTCSPILNDVVGGALMTTRCSPISMSTSVRSPSGSTA